MHNRRFSLGKSNYGSRRNDGETSVTKTRTYAPCRLAQRITPTTKLNKPDRWFPVIRMDYQEMITANTTKAHRTARMM